MAAKVDARKRAREAKARLDAERIERDRKIEEATTQFYVADDRLDELREQLDSATRERDEHVLTLLDLGEAADRVSVLTGLSSRDVRRIKRESDDKTSAGSTVESVAEAV